MAGPIGLSIGATNLVAARIGAQPVLRRAVLTLHDRRPPTVGLPGDISIAPEAGVVISGFVERVGDPVPLVAVDGSAHRADRLLVDALGALAHDAGGVGPSAEITVAVPAYWRAGTVRALAATLTHDRNLAPNGVVPRLVSDSVATLIALRRDPGLPDDGVIALVDCGGSGTSITLADAGRGFQPIADTVRYLEFSGDQIDQAMLAAVLSSSSGTGESDPAATTSVGSLKRLRDECRLAKERLSAQLEVVIPLALPGVTSEVRFTREKLDRLIDAPLDGVIAAVEEALRRDGLTWRDLSAVAVTGGVAGIPMVAQRLSERSAHRVLSSEQPAMTAAAGAALIAGSGFDADAQTGIASSVAGASTAGIGRSGSVGAVLAWSEDDYRASEPVAYVEANPYSINTSNARPRIEYSAPAGLAADAEPMRHRLVQFAVVGAALIALVAAGGVVYSFTSANSTRTPATQSVTTGPAASIAEPPLPPLPPETTVAAPVEAPVPVVTTVVPPPPQTVTRTVTPTTTPPPVTTTVPTTSTTSTTTTTTTTAATTTTRRRPQPQPRHPRRRARHQRQLRRPRRPCR